MSDSAFIHHAQMRFSDTDAMGHVNNARFLSYLEDARIAFLASIAANGADLMAVGLILARLEIDYVKPLQLSAEPIAVEVWVSRLGTKSFGLDYTISHGGAVAARATSVLVGYDYVAGTSRALADAERAGLTRWLRPQVPGVGP